MILLFSVTIFSQDMPIDGTRWNQSNINDKNVYIQGILNGMYVWAALAQFQNYGDTAYCNKLKNSIGYYYKKFFVGHSIEDIRTDLDKFYTDDKNINIEVEDAIWLVEYYNTGEYKNHKIGKDNSKGDKKYYEKILESIRKKSDGN